MIDELCATPTKSIVMCRAQAWLIAAERRGIDITKDPDGYLAVIAGLIAEVARQDERIAYLEPIYKAAKELTDNAEEWECEGLGMWAQHGWWEQLHDALDPDGSEAADDIRKCVTDTK